jgi:hypothetical protein
MGDNRESGVGESTLTVKWWAVILVIASVFGWLVIAFANQDRRITTLEAQIPFISQTVCEVKDTVKEIREEQIKQYQKR